MLNLLEQIANQQQIKNITPIPTFSRGDQDSMEWINEFERCSEINGYTYGDMLNSVKGYLLNEARTWFDRIESNAATQFQSWQTAGNRNFRRAFLTQFRNPGKLLQWRMELNNKIQQLYETVHQYAQDIRRLIKRTETNNTMPESEKVFYFTKGL